MSGEAVAMNARTINVSERRARLAQRHLLVAEAQVSNPAEVARAIVAYHATDPATVYLAAAARTGYVPASALDAALYAERTLVRVLGMRRTMFVVPTDLWPAIHVACTDAIAANERRQTLKMIAEGGITDDAKAWLANAGAGVLKALANRGEATTQQIAEDVPQLRQQIVLARGKPYESKSTLGPRVMFQLAAEGKVIRTRPVKSWSSANRWALTEAWLPGTTLQLPLRDAEQRIARDWLRAFGPGTLADFKWWTGWTMSRARKVLAAVGAVEVELEGGETGYVLPDDLDPVAEPERWAAFLPSLDPAVMGWAMPGRDWYLDGPAKQQLYDRSGNIGPTVWWGGRVVGGWAQRADGTIAHRLFEDIGTDGTQMVADTAGKLEAWLGDVRVKPRFPTPIDKALSA
jgi:hypothetical protein